MKQIQKVNRAYPYRITIGEKQVELSDVFTGVMHLMYFLIASDMCIFDAKVKAIKKAMTIGAFVKGTIFIYLSLTD